MDIHTSRRSLCIFLSFLFNLALPVFSQQLPLIPYPEKIQAKEGKYILPKKVRLYADPSFTQEAALLKEYLKGFCKAGNEDPGKADWQLKSDPSLLTTLGGEGYVLDIGPSGVVIRSATPAGAFYGIQTLRQIVWLTQRQGKKKLQLPCLHIEDRPRFSWRGSMLDIARRFFEPAYIRRHLDRMAMYKLNRLHLHLTDDQGWRIEIKSWPELASYGGSSAVNDGHTGYLTQKEFRELQRYAKQRHIIIVPEIDMPGHIYSALASYPDQLNCPGNSNISTRIATPPQLYHGMKVGWNRLCLTRKESYQFTGDVIGELASMTEGPWIHFGGDEIEDTLYTEFVRQADSTVRSKGKTSIGWEEVMKGKPDTSLIAQIWLGKTPNRQGLRTIVSLCKHFYLDHANDKEQKGANSWCKASGVSLKDVYSYRPDKKDTTVLGVEGALWTELVKDEEEADNRFWPRLTAVAEVSWSHTSDLYFEKFASRLSWHSIVFRKMEISYYPAGDIGWKK